MNTTASSADAVASADCTVTVYSKPNCVQCSATTRALDAKGIPYRYVDVSLDAAAMTHVVEDLGYRQMPAVEAFGQHWAGFQPAKIAWLKDQIEAAALPASAVPASTV